MLEASTKPMNEGSLGTSWCMMVGCVDILWRSVLMSRSVWACKDVGGRCSVHRAMPASFVWWDIIHLCRGAKMLHPAGIAKAVCCILPMRDCIVEMEVHLVCSMCLMLLKRVSSLPWGSSKVRVTLSKIQPRIFLCIANMPSPAVNFLMEIGLPPVCPVICSGRKMLWMA